MRPREITIYGDWPRLPDELVNGAGRRESAGEAIKTAPGSYRVISHHDGNGITA